MLRECKFCSEEYYGKAIKKYCSRICGNEHRYWMNKNKVKVKDRESEYIPCYETNKLIRRQEG